MTKAKQTGFKIYNKHSTNVEYEYRGYTYEVEFANDWSYCITKPHIQHEDAQRRIDELIKNKSNNKNRKYTGECEKALNEWFETLGW